MSEVYRASCFQKASKEVLRSWKGTTIHPGSSFHQKWRVLLCSNPHRQCLINVLLFPLRSLFQITSVKSSLVQSSQGNICMQISFFREGRKGREVYGLSVSVLRMIALSRLWALWTMRDMIYENFSLLGWPTKPVTTTNSQWKESVLFLLTDKCSQYSQNKQCFFIVSIKRMMNVYRAIRRGVYRGDRATGTCLGEKWAVIWGIGKWLQRGLLSRKWSSFSMLTNFTIELFCLFSSIFPIIIFDGTADPHTYCRYII